MNIDWGKQPEGFPLWLEGTNEEHRKHSGWYRRAGEVFEGAFGGQWRACREGQFFTVHRKPESTSWTGEGLPPVGTVCEAEIHDVRGKLGWVEAMVIHHHPHHKESAAIAHGELQLLAWSSKFRPIRTPEQIAAAKRAAAVSQMMMDSLCDSELDEFGRLYDAGYRKQVKP